MNLVLLFDANMPLPDACRPDCESDRTCLCAHRFGPGVKIFASADIENAPGASDLHVVESLIELARHGFPGSSVEDTQWMIVTKDQKFCKSARHQHLSRIGNGSKDLHFSIPGGCVWTRVHGQVLHISIITIMAKPGSVRVELLRNAAASIRRLFKEQSAP